MKKLISILIALTILLSCSSLTAMASEEVKVVFDGELLSFDVPAQIINGRTMVPVRKIFEELGMEVLWDGESQKVTARKKGIQIELFINDTTAYRNSVEQEIDVPAQIIDNRTLVPVRVVSEYAGATVEWDNNTRAVYITSTDNIQHIDWNDTYEYYGEGENGDAYGYGILYNKEDGSVRQMGKYINSQIITGTDYFEDGGIYVGNFEDGQRAYGTYYLNDGSTYFGEFENGLCHGNGVFTSFSENGMTIYTGVFDNNNFIRGKKTYSNSNSYAEGEFEDFTLHGYGKVYDEAYDCLYVGNWVNGSMDGEITVYDYANNTTYTTHIKNGKVVDEQVQNQKNYDDEHAVLIAWAEDKVDEIYAEGENIYNQIMNQVDTSMTTGSASNGGNIDNYAAANAMRQQAALIEQYKRTAEATKTEYIAEQLELLADFVQQQENELKAKYNIK